MPPIDVAKGGVDFSGLLIVVQEDIDKKSAVVISYGKFIQTVIEFIIIAFAIFMAVKSMNSLKRKEAGTPVTPAAPPNQELLLVEIRDLLKKK